MRLKVLCLLAILCSIFFVFLPQKTQAQPSSTKKNTVDSINKQDGLSFETAVIISETSELKGLNAENKWIKDHYLNFKLKTQTLSMHDNKPFDVITIIVPTDKEIKLYFNIENFYNKF